MPTTPTGLAYDAGPERHDEPPTPPVLLLHAGIADRTMWDPQWAGLTERGRAVRMDLRGFGESATAPPAGAVDHVADVLEVMAHAGVDRAHVVAASFGAGVAVELALSAPERVASLALAPPGGALLAEATADFTAFLAAEESALAADDLDGAVAVNVDSWVVGNGRTRADVPPAVLAHVGRMQRRAFEIDAAFGDVDEVELDPPALDRLSEVRVPTLLVTGAHDLATTHDAARRILAGVPDVRHLHWEDAAHLPSLEHPERFAAVLTDWLRD